MSAPNNDRRADVMAAYAREQTDVLRFMLRRTIDATAMVELLLRDGPDSPAADQSAALLRDLRDEFGRLAASRLPNEQLMTYGDGSPITDNERVNGRIARKYLPWPEQFSVAGEDDEPEDGGHPDDHH